MEYILLIYIILYIIGIVLFLQSEIFLELKFTFPPDVTIFVMCIANISLLITAMFIYYWITIGLIWIETQYTVWRVTRIVNKIIKKYKL